MQEKLQIKQRFRDRLMESEDHRIVIQMDMVTATAEEILPDQNRSKNWPLFVLAQEIIFFSFYGYKLGKKKKKKRNRSPEMKCSSYSKERESHLIQL